MNNYFEIRGFNVHGDWGSHGITQWLNFDVERYKKMIAIALERFPKMNTVRIWLSFDAYMADKKRFLENVNVATDILTDKKLSIIPIYLNGWAGLPSFGSFCTDNIYEHLWPVYEKYVSDTAKVLKTKNILMHDVANEPFNNFWESQKPFVLDETKYKSLKEQWVHNDVWNRTVAFLKQMIKIVREIDDRPITVGSEGWPDQGDIDALAPMVDVISLHPYNIAGLSQPDFEKSIKDIIDYIKALNKPYIITECAWGAATAEKRLKFLESELETYSKLNIGFICHALFTCPVSDLYPQDNDNHLYMAFLDKNFNIRKYHDLFNKYC